VKKVRKAKGTAITMTQYNEHQEGTSLYSSLSNGSSPARPISTNGGLNPHAISQDQVRNVSSSDNFVSSFDYDYITSVACVAIYDTMTSTPQIIQIPGGPTHKFIEDIASTVYKEAQQRGGMLPYTVIREVTENFIHANFNEPVVSIFDRGNTIRFADQGPGIKDKDLAQQPGFTSASEPMKKYIRGVGSGLPLVKEVLGFSHGTIKIEDNINQGSVVTISLLRNLEDEAQMKTENIPSFTENDKVILQALLPHKILGVTDMRKETGLANASIYATFSKLEEAGILEKVNKKRQLTDKGIQIALSV
jgi:hypothetical protein